MGIGAVLLKSAKYAKRALNITPEFVFGTSANTIGKAARTTKGSIFQKAKAEVLAFEKEVARKKAAEGGFFKRMWNNIKGLKDIPQEVKASATKSRNQRAIVKLAAKKNMKPHTLAKMVTIKGGAKGLGKAIMKRLPFLQQAAWILMDAPNIYRAFRDEGIGTGLKETGWLLGEMGGLAAGSAIGTLICPGIGSIIGGIIGSVGVSMLRGGSYTDKKDQLKEEYKLSDEQISEYQKQGYTVDSMLNELKKSSTDASADTSSNQDQTSSGSASDSSSSNTSSDSTLNDTTSSSDMASATPLVSNPISTMPSFGGITSGLTPSYNFGYSVPFGMGMSSMNNPFAGAFNSTYTPILPPGQSLFDLYDFGYRFKYQG